MPQNSLLAICIPTYNRAEILRICLESIIPEAASYNIPIFISDNSSTDSTPVVIKSISKKYPYLHFSRNSSNVGFDRNLLKAVSETGTEYVWPIGDRHVIPHDSITHILHILEKKNMTL